jgi:hypothetical protein
MSKSNHKANEANESNENTYCRIWSAYPRAELEDDLIELFPKLLAEADLDHRYLQVEEIVEQLDRTDSKKKVGRSLKPAADRSEFVIEDWSHTRWLLYQEGEQ